MRSGIVGYQWAFEFPERFDDGIQGIVGVLHGFRNIIAFSDQLRDEWASDNIPTFGLAIENKWKFIYCSAHFDLRLLEGG